MTRFHLHVYNRTGCALDDEGEDLEGLADAERKAIAGIRGILSEEVKTGTLDLHGRIDVARANGEVLRTIRYSEALEVRPDTEAG